MSIEELIATSHHRRRLPDPMTLRLLRKRAHLTQAEFAEALGVERASVSRYESGLRVPRGPVLDRYLDLLDRLAAPGS